MDIGWYWNSTYVDSNYIWDITDIQVVQPVQPVNIAGLRIMIYFNIAVFVVLMLLYELLRKLYPTVYFSRQKLSIETNCSQDAEIFEDNPVLKDEMHSPAIPVMGRNTSFFQWIRPIYGISWRRIREAAGLDAYFYLRYIRMCYRITTVTAIWGLIVLFPVYWTGNNEEVDIYHFSMANVRQDCRWRIWVSTVFMYMFSFFVFYVMKNELTHYMELRLDFLGKGEKDVNPQQNYSIMLENVPKELRSDRALYDYFDKLFPGKVHSASVMLNLPELEILSLRKKRVTGRLEKSIAHYEATRERPTHIMGRPRLNCCDIEFSPLECTCCKGAKIHDMDDGDAKRGHRVDSIQYYTYDLQRANRDLFLLQKEKLSIAEAGNRSLRATGWFAAVSKIADMFIEENDDYDNSYADSDLPSNSESWNCSRESKDAIDAPQTWSSSEGFTWSGSKDNIDSISFGSKDSCDDRTSWSVFDEREKIPTTRSEEFHSSNDGLSVARSEEFHSSNDGLSVARSEELHYKIERFNSTHIRDYKQFSESIITPPKTTTGVDELGSEEQTNTAKTSNVAPPNEQKDIHDGALQTYSELEMSPKVTSRSILQTASEEPNNASKFATSGILRTRSEEPKKVSLRLFREEMKRSSVTSATGPLVSVQERKLSSVKESTTRAQFSLDATRTLSDVQIESTASGVALNSSMNSSFRYGSLDEERSGSFRKPSKLKRVKWSLTKNKSDGIIGDLESQSREEPLIDNSFLVQEEAIHGRYVEERKAHNFQEEGLDIKKKKRVSRLGGRLGLDFAMYGVKLLNKKLLKTFDTPDECRFMSSTAFVTFYDLASVTFAAGVPLTHSPDSLDVTVAPEARDVIWENAHLSQLKTKRRINTAHVLLSLGIFFWGIPLTLIQLVSSAERVAQLPGMSWVLEAFDGNLAVLIDAYLPVAMLLCLILLLPLVLEDIAMNYEKRKTRSDIDRCVVDRYFYYQLANIYICVTAGSVWKSLVIFSNHPAYFLDILGNTVPTLAGYFIALLVTKIFGGLPIIILRCTALGRYLVLRMMHREKFLTQRDIDQVHRQEPVWYGWEYPNQLMVMAICFTFVCISPVVLFFGALFFFVSLMVYKKQVLYVYTPTYESGGALFPMVIDRTIVGLICGQVTLIGYCSIRGGFYQPLFLAPLVYISFWMKRYFDTRYADPSKKLTLERAIELDEKIGTFLASSKGVRPKSPGKKKNGMPPQIAFTSDYYRQPVLTEPPGEPLPYRSGRDDEMTIESRVHLSQNRINMR